MKNLFVVIFAASMLFAQTPDPKSKQAVMAAMETYRQGMLQKDGSMLDKVLSPDLTYTHSAGQFETKADVIKSVTSGKTITQKMEFTDTTVRIYGQTALVKGRVDLWHSDTDIVHMNILFVWVNGAQGWQMVARQATKLAN